MGRSPLAVGMALGFDRRPGEQTEDVFQLYAELLELGVESCACGRLRGILANLSERKLGLRPFARFLGLGGEDLARTGDGVSLGIEQPLDAQHQFDIALAIE